MTKACAWYSGTAAGAGDCPRVRTKGPLLPELEHEVGLLRIEAEVFEARCRTNLPVRPSTIHDSNGRLMSSWR